MRIDATLAKALRNPIEAEVVVDAEARMLAALRRVQEERGGAGGAAGDEEDHEGPDDAELLVIEFPPAEGAKRGIGPCKPFFFSFLFSVVLFWRKWLRRRVHACAWFGLILV